MQRRVFLFLVALVALPAVAQATVTVTMGNHNLAPGTPGQIVDILISATEGEGLNSADLDILINNLNPGGPIVTAIDLVSAATVWGASPSTQAGGIDPPSSTEIFNSVTVDSTTTNVPANGVLARLTFSTVGVANGMYPWLMDDDAASNGGTFGSAFFSTTAQHFPTFLPGTLNVVPEPSSVVMGVFAVAGLAFVAVRRRARRAA